MYIFIEYMKNKRLLIFYATFLKHMFILSYYSFRLCVMYVGGRRGFTTTYAISVYHR